MRYFLEVAYKGTRYAGFQVQHNANTIQAEVEKALGIRFKKSCKLTGASRTDAGVHAYQNFFHVDVDFEIPSASIYNLNAILPTDIVIKSIFSVNENDHCRFHATSREYKYYIYRSKNAFLAETAWYFPYNMKKELLDEAAAIVMEYSDFTSFSKRNTQTKSNKCIIFESRWYNHEETLVYNVRANRFLRGMVRGLVATMLKVGREMILLADFKAIIEARDCTKADFTSPAHGLFLTAVEYTNSPLIFNGDSFA
jgi:tRNA pseudouridine38-40 synthase